MGELLLARGNHSKARRMLANALLSDFKDIKLIAMFLATFLPKGFIDPVVEARSMIRQRQREANRLPLR
jgi:hypothetical protein